MLLELNDSDIVVKLLPRSDDRMRLTIDYPRTPEYRDRIQGALGDLLKPKTRQVVTRQVRKVRS